MDEYFVTDLEETWGISIWAKSQCNVTLALRAMFDPELDCSGWGDVIWVGNQGFKVTKECHHE